MNRNSNSRGKNSKGVSSAKKKSNYKKKRSFTRNKKLRKDSPEKSEGSSGEGGVGSGKRHFRGHFDREKRESNKDKRAERKEQFSAKGKTERSEKKFDGGRPFKKVSRVHYESKPFKKQQIKETYADKGLIRLNKYIANAGICSRREADDLIRTGCITVNGQIVTELGYKVKPSDEVSYSGQRLKTEKHVYILLNKPKDYITTAEDERGRRTVMELIKGAAKERVYPVGRLDRNTLGLLLFTNDGEMAKKLTHPKHRVQKLYHVELDKNLKQDDLVKIQNGMELEDGFLKPDEVAYAGESKREVGILIHSGRNRIVRRIFEQLGYDVVRLDRVMFAGLTKKDLPRGHWRRLTDKEVAFLKMI